MPEVFRFGNWSFSEAELRQVVEFAARHGIYASVVEKKLKDSLDSSRRSYWAGRGGAFP